MPDDSITAPATHVPAIPPLPHALSGERHETTGRAGRLSYYVAGEGRPLLLVHSVNAAASACEVRPIFEHAKASRRVYAVDLPGYGFSDRAPREYNVALFVASIRDMLDVIAGDRSGAPVDVLALSLGAEFVARAATETPARFRTLTFVTPTGFSRRASAAPAPAGATREIPGLYRALQCPLWRRGVFRLLTSRRSIRYFLGRTWGSPRVDEGLLEYDVVTAQQRGARNAPYAFVSGRLFSRDIVQVYRALQMPVWVPHGTRGDFGDFSRADLIADRPNWSFQAFDAGALPHFERTAEFLAAFDRFLDAPRD